jgi:hypothetical protein
MKQCIAKKEALLGQKHKNTLLSMTALASIYQDQGKYKLAEALHQKVLDIQKSSLGAMDPGTLMSMMSLAKAKSKGGHDTPIIFVDGKQINLEDFSKL